jgi:NAD(P)-dependent dehydrogenase (short-subunit alcohol dehydrogenase family)
MAKVLVIGATRGIGLETVKAALRSGHSVRALARSAARIPIQDADLDKMSGNALDRDIVQNALRDVGPRSDFVARLTERVQRLRAA